MVAVHSYPVAIALCVITMLCWGSWANTRKLAGTQWRFEVFYWDYVFGMVLLALQAALTFGSNGADGRSFWATSVRRIGSRWAPPRRGGGI